MVADKAKVIGKITEDIVRATIKIGLPVAWHQSWCQSSEWTGYFIASENQVVPLGCAAGLGHGLGHALLLSDLRLDHLVGILENGIRETDESNRFDDVRSQYHYLKELAAKAKE